MRRTPKPYWHHWKLARNPFGNITNADDVFESGEMGRVMDHLAEAVEEGGIYAVTGERGVGKTTVKNETIEYFRRNEDTFAFSVLEYLDPQIRMSQIHMALVMDFSSEAVKQNTEQRARQVRRILGELAARRRVVLILDEAQKLRVRMLEQFKQLTEMKWGFRSRLITVLLFGQPELMSLFGRDKGLLHRVTAYQMKGLTEDEVLQYIDQRCRAAGGTMAEIFDEEALVYLAENLHTPLHINHVCGSCMRAARHAGEKRVTLGIIYGCSGIRTPRQVLRDAGLSLQKFAARVGVRVADAGKVLSGDSDGIDPDKRERIQAGFSSIVRGGDNGNRERKTA